LYAICQRIPLADLLAVGPKKFKDARDFTLHALKALSVYEDAERDPPVITPTPLDWDDVKTFFTQQVQTLARRYLKA